MFYLRNVILRKNVHIDLRTSILFKSSKVYEETKELFEIQKYVFSSLATLSSCMWTHGPWT